MQMLKLKQMKKILRKSFIEFIRFDNLIYFIYKIRPVEMITQLTKQ